MLKSKMHRYRTSYTFRSIFKTILICLGLVIFYHIIIRDSIKKKTIGYKQKKPSMMITNNNAKAGKEKYEDIYEFNHVNNIETSTQNEGKSFSKATQSAIIPQTEVINKSVNLPDEKAELEESKAITGHPDKEVSEAMKKYMTEKMLQMKINHSKPPKPFSDLIGNKTIIIQTGNVTPVPNITFGSDTLIKIPTKAHQNETEEPGTINSADSKMFESQKSTSEVNKISIEHSKNLTADPNVPNNVADSFNLPNETQEPKKNNIIENTSTDLKAKKSVLIISSLGAVSEPTSPVQIITTFSNDSIHIFEPEKYLENGSCVNNVSCSVNFFRNLFMCKNSENQNLFTWLLKYQPFLDHYNLKTRSCNNLDEHVHSKCLNETNILNDCKTTSLKIIQAIRFNLKDAIQLLDDDQLDLKIIHLYRDPRMGLLSLKGKDKNTRYPIECFNFLEDLNAYDKAKDTKHSSRILKMSVESFFTDPIGWTEKLYSFIFNRTQIPETTSSRILADYASVKAKAPPTNSTIDYNNYQSWRGVIDNKVLVEIESIDECKSAIEKIGHKLFGSQEYAKDLNTSLFQS